MVRKFFPLDKNYLLEEAQLLLQDSLLSSLVEIVKEHHERIYNPLGIPDALTLRIRAFKLNDQPERRGQLQALSTFYQNLAGVYRYKFGQNQLEFLWTGEDHSSKYGEDWASFFHTQSQRFCQNPQFVRAVLDLTVFLPENSNAQLAENRMNAFMLQTFEVKIHKQRGIMEMKVA